MNRTEFIEILRNQLAGQMQESRAAAHIRYYQDYIQSQVRAGRSEEEVLNELGDPRLIAKTLIDTNPDAGEAVYEEYEESCYEGFSDEETPSHSDIKTRKIDLSTWYGKALVILCAVLVLAALVAIIGAVLPFVIVFALIVYLLSWWKKKYS